MRVFFWTDGKTRMLQKSHGYSLESVVVRQGLWDNEKIPIFPDACLKVGFYALEGDNCGEVEESSPLSAFR